MIRSSHPGEDLGPHSRPHVHARRALGVGLAALVAWGATPLTPVPTALAAGGSTLSGVESSELVGALARCGGPDADYDTVLLTSPVTLEDPAETTFDCTVDLGGEQASFHGLTVAGGSLTITDSATGGRLTTQAATGSEQAGISVEAVGRLTIAGGTVVARGVKHAPGIGLEQATPGPITITGGTVEAIGGTYGAGIGPGATPDRSIAGGTVTITGGDVTAVGNQATGIGGVGSAGGGGTVTISGLAKVKAFGSSPDLSAPRPAAVGGGAPNGSLGDVTLTDQAELRVGSPVYLNASDAWAGSFTVGADAVVRGYVPATGEATTPTFLAPGPYGSVPVQNDGTVVVDPTGTPFGELRGRVLGNNVTLDPTTAGDPSYAVLGHSLGSMLGGPRLAAPETVPAGKRFVRWTAVVEGTPTTVDDTTDLRGLVAARWPEDEGTSTVLPITPDFEETERADLAPASPPVATVGTAYSWTVPVTGTPKPSLYLTDGELPAGLTFDADAGTISGTPTGVGSSTFTLQADNDVEGGDTETYTITVQAPTFTWASPSMTGKAAVGSSYGVFTVRSRPDVPLTYQWQRRLENATDFADLAGATGATYTATPADAGSTLRVAITAAKTGYTTSTIYGPSQGGTVVAAGHQDETVLPQVTLTWPGKASEGAPRTDEVVTATLDRELPDGVSVSYAWGVVEHRWDLRTISPLPMPCSAGGLIALPVIPYPDLLVFRTLGLVTDGEHVVTAGEVGTQVCVVATFSRDGYDPVERTASTPTVVEAAFTGTLTGAFTGTSARSPYVGDVVTASVVGTLAPEPTSVERDLFLCLAGVVIDPEDPQELQGCTPAGHGTQEPVLARSAVPSGLQLTDAMVDKTLVVVWSAQRAGYATVSGLLQSAPISHRPVVPSGPSSFATAPTVTLSSTAPQVGQPLTATVTGGEPSQGVTRAYAWLVGGVVVPGATQATYTPTAADVGEPVAVRVTSSLPGYVDDVTTSAASAATVVGRLVLGSPSVTGTPQVGSLLTAVAPEGVEATDSVAYEWSRMVDGEPVILGTGSTYRVAAADLDHVLTLTTTVTRAGYAPASSSVRATTVAAGELAAVVASVTGTPQVGRTVSARVTGDQPDGSTVTYRWLSGTTLLGTGRTLPVRAAAVDAPLVLQVAVTVPGYATRTATATTAPVAEGVLALRRPVLSGVARAHARLTARIPGGLRAPGATVTWAWFANGVEVKSGSGRDAGVLWLASEHVGQRVWAVATVTAPGYAPRTVTSQHTDLVRSRR